MIQDLQPLTYWMIFFFAGLAWIGISLIFAAGWYFFMRAINPEPTPDEKRWSRDWESIERDINQ